MPAPSKVERLAPEDKAWLDQALIANAFSGYEELAAQLAARGIDIGKSSLHRYGSQYEERIKMLRASQEVAKAIVQEMGDEQANLAEAVGQLALDQSMRLLMTMNIDPDNVDFPDLIKSISALTRTQVGLRKYQAEVRAKIKAVASETSKSLRKVSGISDELADDIVDKILGIAK